MNEWISSSMTPLVSSEDNKQRIQDLIELFRGGNAKIIGVPTELIHFIGDAGKAVLLTQLIYWSNRGSRRDGLIFKTYKEIYNETGIKEKTCHRYYKEFKEMGFFDWDVKKAYGNPTIHYKLDVDKLAELLQTFWENQNGQNDRTKTVNMSKSLTENTTEISLSKTLENFKGEENVNDKDFTVKESILMFDGNSPSNKIIDGFNLGEKILLPANFAPTRDKQFRAVMEFPDKSPAYVTKKFKDHYGCQNTRRTLFEWNNKWWDWMIREIPLYLSDTRNLEKERHEILYNVWNKIFRSTYSFKNKVVSRDEFCQTAKGVYCEQTIDDCLKVLVEDEDFGCVKGYYFNFTEYKESTEWKTAVDDELRALGLSFHGKDKVVDSIG
jgi:hypothetical protein